MNLKIKTTIKLISKNYSVMNKIANKVNFSNQKKKFFTKSP